MRLARRTWLRGGAVLLAAVAGVAASQTGRPAGTILIVGDSLSAEYGLPRGTGWVALLERRLTRQKIAAPVVNASISGDTSAGGRSRLPALLREHRPALLVIELGGNDALRGLPLAATRANLAAMVQAGKAAGARVLLVGMQVPPNYGRRYADEFEALFTQVSRAEGAELVPFLLEGVADAADTQRLFQPDRIHPNEQAQPIMLDNVWPRLHSMLTRQPRR